MRTKSRKADLEGKKILFFEVGAIIALSLALAAFEWQTEGDITLNLPKPNTPDVTIELIPITRPEKIIHPAPPPPVEIIFIRENDEIVPETDLNSFNELEPEQVAQILKEFENDEPEVDEVIPFFQIEIKPSFMGGDYNKFTEWVFKNLRYPEEAAQNGIQGRVYLEFLIDIDGYIKNVKVIKGVDRLLDAEAVRVVSSSPPWKPGFQRDKPTKVLFTFPINFRLN